MYNCNNSVNTIWEETQNGNVGTDEEKKGLSGSSF